MRIMGSYATRSSREEKIKQFKQLKRELQTAKTMETKAERAYYIASGAERMTNSVDTVLKQKRREETTKAYHKFIDAVEKREKIEKKIKRFSQPKSSTVPF